MVDPTIRERLRELDDRHFPTTRERRPGWEVCQHDSMTWPCETQKALDLAELLWAELATLERRAIAAEEVVSAATEWRDATDAYWGHVETSASSILPTEPDFEPWTRMRAADATLRAALEASRGSA